MRTFLFEPNPRPLPPGERAAVLANPGRRHRAVPPGGQRTPVPQLRRPARHAPAPRRAVPRVRAHPGPGRPGLDPHDRRHPATHRHDLPGITRDSLITLARDLGHTVHEEPYAIDRWQADADSGRLTEAFACGTAAVVTPIGAVKGRDRAFTIGDGGPGQVARRLRSALLDIQTGRAPDRHGWLDRLP